MTKFQKGKRMKSIVLFAALFTTLFLGSVSVAQAGKAYFELPVKPFQGNTYTSAQYRSTDNKNNAWMVDLQSSTETKGTVSTFWLVNTNNSAVSDKHDVWAGSGERTYASYKSGTKTNVKLAAENNTYNTEAYIIKGNWNPETGIKVAE